MSDRHAMAEPADINVDELRRRARRRLVGAVVLALGVAVVVPMLLETEQKPLGEDVAVKIPPIDDGKFVNRLSESRARDDAATAGKSQGAKDDAASTRRGGESATGAERTSKYDTHVPDTTPVTPPSTTSGGENPKPGMTAPATSLPGEATATSPASTSASPASTSPSAPAAKAGAAAPATTKADAAKDAGDGTERAKSLPEKSSPRADAKVATAAPSTLPSHPAASEAKAPTPHDGFAVQLAAFADDKGANALAGRLKRAGYAAYTEPLKTSKGTLWRVRVGPYASREAAIAARDRLKIEGQSGIVAAVK
jgi:DedD protein